MFIFKEPSFVIRNLKEAGSQKIYLTFDDGPSAETTPAVLDLLKKYNCTATFFVIGLFAEKNKSLIERIQTDGHSLMSHSIDHNYSNYFKNSKNIQKWLQDSLEHLSVVSNDDIQHFRPPAGVINPPLLNAAKKLKIPLILWTHRFYDTVFCLTKKKIDNKINKISDGDIILLHDRQKDKNRTEFLVALEYLIINLKKINLEVSAIKKSDLDSIRWV